MFRNNKSSQNPISSVNFGIMARSSALQVLRTFSKESGKSILEARHYTRTVNVISIQSSSISTGDENISHIIKSRLPEITVPKTSLYDIIWESGINKFGNKIATVGTNK